MADIKQKYGTSGQALTITLASLTNTSLRQSAYVDNATTLFFNAIVTASITLNSSGVSSTGIINIYAYASSDGGTLYTSGASGSDAAYTAEKLNLVLVASLDANTNSEVVSTTFDIASAFGGVMPERWGVVVENATGAALGASGHSVKYQGVYGQA